MYTLDDGLTYCGFTSDYPVTWLVANQEQKNTKKAFSRFCRLHKGIKFKKLSLGKLQISATISSVWPEVNIKLAQFLLKLTNK